MKSPVSLTIKVYTLSLPLRERGLKSMGQMATISCWESLPLRERGLKLQSLNNELTLAMVAPLAGAWIEITPCQHQQRSSGSLPLRERGLKFYGLLYIPLAAAVAPLAGAWIEILD